MTNNANEEKKSENSPILFRFFFFSSCMCVYFKIVAADVRYMKQ